MSASGLDFVKDPRRELERHKKNRENLEEMLEKIEKEIEADECPNILELLDEYEKVQEQIKAVDKEIDKATEDVKCMSCIQCGVSPILVPLSDYAGVYDHESLPDDVSPGYTVWRNRKRYLVCGDCRNDNKPKSQYL
jgi:hypothetical protein